MVGYPSFINESASFLANSRLSFKMLPKETYKDLFFPLAFHPSIHYVSWGVSSE